MIDSAHRIKFEHWYFDGNLKAAERDCLGGYKYMPASIAWKAYDEAYRQAIEDASAKLKHMEYDDAAEEIRKLGEAG